MGSFATRLWVFQLIRLLAEESAVTVAVEVWNVIPER